MLPDTLANQNSSDGLSPARTTPQLIWRPAKTFLSSLVAAYYVLQKQGWLEVRPKSGYYVRRRAYKPMAVPNATEVLSRPIIATTSQLVMDVQRDGSKPHAISFSRATPALDFPIIRRMQQTYTRHADWGSGYQNESLTQKEKNKIIISDK